MTVCQSFEALIVLVTEAVILNPELVYCKDETLYNNGAEIGNK